MENEFYTANEIAEMAGCSRRIVYNMRHKLIEAGFAVRVGRTLIYHKSAVEMVIDRPDRRRKNE